MKIKLSNKYKLFQLPFTLPKDADKSDNYDPKKHGPHSFLKCLALLGLRKKSLVKKEIKGKDQLYMPSARSLLSNLFNTHIIDHEIWSTYSEFDLLPNLTLEDGYATICYFSYKDHQESYHSLDFIIFKNKTLQYCIPYVKCGDINELHTFLNIKKLVYYTLLYKIKSEDAFLNINKLDCPIY